MFKQRKFKVMGGNLNRIHLKNKYIYKCRDMLLKRTVSTTFLITGNLDLFWVIKENRSWNSHKD